MNIKEVWDRWLAILEKPILGNNVAVWGLSLFVGFVAFIALRITVRSLSRRLSAGTSFPGP